MDMLRITDLHKSFGDKKVLCGLDLSVPEHSVFGFIGRNGWIAAVFGNRVQLVIY